MNDDVLPPELELASAYLDGDVDDAQRAEVEGSPELMSLVGSFRGIAASLADTPPADPAAREAAVAAALAEFDVLRAPRPTVTAPNVLPLHRHTRWSRVVMGAAAALLLGGVGVAAINGFGGSQDQASSATVAQKVGAAEAADTEAADAAGGAVAPTQTIGAINSAATPVPRLDEPEQLLSLSAPGTPAVEAVGDDTLSAATETTAVTETVAVPATAAGDGPDTAETTFDAAPTSRAILSFTFTCPLTADQVILLEISWKGTPAVAVRDTVTGVIQAVDAQCNVLASAP